MSTLNEALPIYLDTASDIAPSTRKKLGYLMTSWAKRTTNPKIEAIDATTFADFRRNCLACSPPLSADTIETSITDILTILEASGLRPDPGRRLRRKKPNPRPPQLSTVGRIYLAAENATHPRPRVRKCSATVWLRTFMVMAYWTALRLDDLLRLKWQDIEDDAIRHVAEKTQKLHEFPMCSVVRRHLEQMPRGRGGHVFDVSPVNQTRVRKWLAMLCASAGVPRITPKNLRQLGITRWDCASALAGGIVHGKDLGVLENYLGQLVILQDAAPRFVWPKEMLSADERDERESGINQLVELARRVPTKRLSDLHRVAVAFAE